MIKLPADFELDRYGLHVRFVQECDAEFIIKLRTDPELSKFIHETKNDLDKQREWIRGYKQKEKGGTEYYFIFYSMDKPVGLNRIYRIESDGTFTTGSWLFSKDAPMEASIASAIIVREIAFETLDLKFENGFDGCHEDNKKVLRFNRMLGLKDTGIITDSKGKYCTMTLTKDDFEVGKGKILKILNYIK